MSEEPDRKSSPVWAMLLTVIAAWVACAGYRYRSPGTLEARALVGVPATTDLGTMCRQPETAQQAMTQLEIDGAEFLLLDHHVPAPQLSGTISARKLPASERPPSPPSDLAASHVASAASKHVPVETWELTYCTRKADRALAEFSAVLTVLEQRVRQAAPQHSASAASRIQKQIQHLEGLHSQLESQLQTLPAVDTGTLTTASQRTAELQAAIDRAESDYELARQDWALIDRELTGDQQFAALAEFLKTESIKETLLTLEQHRRRSAELLRLNAAERKMEEIYGDRHPRLLEVRKQFQTLLDQLGSWEAVIDESHLAEHVAQLRDTDLAARQDALEEIALRSELEGTELDEATQASQQEADLKMKLASVAADLGTVREALLAASPAPQAALTVLAPPEMADWHWWLNTGVWFGLATACGLVAGGTIHRAWSSATSPVQAEPVPASTVSIISSPIQTLNLAQRRALRQARLRETYA